ncbi:MAG: MFS transporter [Novosphingobium sp.]|nr:MFS transporter [Novosphingobium sp.]
MQTGFMIGWRQVASCFVLLGSIAMITSAYGVVAVPLGEEFNPSRMVLMLGVTVVSVTSALLAPPIGGLLDRFSIRRLMLIGAFMMVAGYATLSLVTSFIQVLLVFGLLIAPANVLMGTVAATVLLSRWFVKRRGRAIGIAIAGVSMGGILFPPFLQLLLDSFAWREAFRLFALILACIVIPAAALVVNAPADKGLHPDGDDNESELARSEVNTSLVSSAEILKDPAFWMISFLFAVVLAGMIGIVTNLPSLAIGHGVSATNAALLISIFSGAGFAAKLGFAAIADLFRLRTLTMLGFAGYAVGLACLTQSHLGYWMIALGAGLIGMFGGMMVPMKSLLVPRVFGQRVVGRAMGMMSTVTLVISIATPPAFGLAYDLTGSYVSVMAIFAAMAVVAMLAVPYIRMDAKVPAAA